MGRKKKELTDEEKRLAYEAHRADMAARSAEQSAAGRDIGPIPAPADPERRAACSRDYLLFCRTYRPNVFTKPFSKSQRAAALLMQQAILDGGTYAWCMSRGGAKTTHSEGVTCWGLLYGHIRFAILAGASKDAAGDSYEAIKYEIESNDLLLADFPEVCLPVRRLEGKPQRAAGMLADGAELRFEWSNRQLVFPMVPGSKSAGAILRSMGYGGRLRGQKFHSQRPDFLILDDIQKDTTARNPRNVQRDLTILQSTIKGMKNRGGKFTVLVPGTRLNPHCFMSQVTDRQKFPDYQGRIFKAMPKMPVNLDLWQDYKKAWIQGTSDAWAENPDDPDAWRKGYSLALEFYRQNRAKMDAGAEVDWPEMFDSHEISGIQNMMDIYLFNEAGFFAEYQNSPLTDQTDTRLTEEMLAQKVLQDLPAGMVPRGTKYLTLGCDVQKELLYWLVTAWRDGFAGHIVAYGTIPEQNTVIFKAVKPPQPLRDLYPAQSMEGRHNIAVNALISALMERDWECEDGGVMQIDRGFIDANWEESRETITTAISRAYRQYEKNGKFSAFPLLPSRGRNTAGESRKRDIEARCQFAYLLRPETDAKGKRLEPCGTVWVMTNKVKSYAVERLTAPVGAPGSVTIHGARAGMHSGLFDHFTAEYPTPASEGTLTYDKWKMKPGRLDNHWWDCFCLTVTANAMQGQRLDVHDAPPKRLFSGGVDWDKVG